MNSISLKILALVIVTNIGTFFWTVQRMENAYKKVLAERSVTTPN